MAKVLKIITSVGTSGNEKINGYNLSGRLFEKDQSEALEMASKHMKKMLSIIGQQGNANQNHMRYFFPLGWLQAKRQTRAGEQVEKWEPLPVGT